MIARKIKIKSNMSEINIIFWIGSPLRSHISSAIIKLNEDGIIQRLKTKWWKKEHGGSACSGGGSGGENTESGGGSVNELGLQNVGGIFLVLLLGLIVGCVIAVVEKGWKTFTNGRKFLT